MLLGGDLLIATVDGIVPCSQAIQKDSGAARAGAAHPQHQAAVARRGQRQARLAVDDEATGTSTAASSSPRPGGTRRARGTASSPTTRPARGSFYDLGRDVLIRMRGDMFFGTQNGIVMQADRTGYDDGLPYTATLVGGWEMFQSAAARRHVAPGARGVHLALGQPFQPQLAATVDYVVTIPPPPPPGLDPGVLDVWDEGLWDRRAVGRRPRPAKRPDPQHHVGLDRHERLCPCADRAGDGRRSRRAGRRTDRDRGDVRARRHQRVRAEGPGSLFERYDPEGALGGLFAPAYIAGYAPSGQAVQAWQAQQRPVSANMIDELRMPEPFAYPNAANAYAAAGAGNVCGEGRIPQRLHFRRPARPGRPRRVACRRHGQPG